MKRGTYARQPAPHQRYQGIILAAVALLLALVACQQGLVEEVPSRTAPVVPTPPQKTSTAPPTLPAQSTVTLPPIPTSTLEPSPTACAHEYFFVPVPPSCPAGEPLASFAAEQPFEGGVMIWFEDTDSIYVFTKNQRWQRFDDSWSEDQPANDPAIIPPAERYQPVRGFGKVWREHQDVREQLGWALGPELAFDAMIQRSGAIDDGDVLFLATFNGQVFALTGRDSNEGDWVVAASS